MNKITYDVENVQDTEINSNSNLTFGYLSAPVGSGKTQAIVEEISADPENNFIYVTPTRQLASEVYERLSKAFVGRKTSNAVHLIVDENKTYGPSVIRRTLRAINNREPDERHTLVITTANFKELLARMHDHNKSKYHVFIDEGIDVLETAEFNTPHTELFMETIDIADDGEFISTGSKRQLLEYVASNPDRLASVGREELSGKRFKRLAYFITSGIHDVYGHVNERSIRAIAFLSPEKFRSFGSVVMIMANFEKSLIALFWSKKYGVEFKPYVVYTDLYDTHQNKGPKMSILYALHPTDGPSKGNLQRNWSTGDHGESGVDGERAIDRIAQILGEKFDGENYCWSANRFFTNEDGALNENRMPIKCAGLDDYKGFNTIFVLACMNPAPWVKSLITRHIKIGDSELYERWRFEDTYQTVGRCSLRDRKSDNDLTVVVLSKQCALQLAEIFRGASIDGQITDLPSYSEMRKTRGPAKSKTPYLKSDNSAWYRYKNSSSYQGETKEEWFKKIRNVSEPQSPALA